MIKNQERNEFVNLISLSQIDITLFEWIIEKASRKQQRWITNSCNPSVGWLFRESEKGKEKKIDTLIERKNQRRKRNNWRAEKGEEEEWRENLVLELRAEVRGGIRDWRLGTTSTCWPKFCFPWLIWYIGHAIFFFAYDRLWFFFIPFW